jgi:CDP-alcohol phosphatidyltransferase
MRRLKRAGPSLVTALRIALLPWIWTAWVHGHVAQALWLYVLASLTDWLDGWMARRLETASAFGGFLDVATDISFLLTFLILLGLRGSVPIWLFVGPLIAAGAFLLTSKPLSPRYDPIGKHFGGVLYVLVGCLLSNPCPTLCTAACTTIGGLSLIVAANRWRVGRSVAARRAGEDAERTVDDRMRCGTLCGEHGDTRVG